MDGADLIRSATGQRWAVTDTFVADEAWSGPGHPRSDLLAVAGTDRPRAARPGTSASNDVTITLAT